MIKEKKKRPARSPHRRHPASIWWLVTKDQHGCTEVLVMDYGDEQALVPVFSSEDEAEMFVRFAGTHESDWLVREVSVGELVSALYGLCEGVRSIALDPCPETLASESIGLVSLDRRRFVNWIADWSTRLLSDERTHSSKKAW